MAKGGQDKISQSFVAHWGEIQHQALTERVERDKQRGIDPDRAGGPQGGMEPVGPSDGVEVVEQRPARVEPGLDHDLKCPLDRHAGPVQVRAQLQKLSVVQHRPLLALGVEIHDGRVEPAKQPVFVLQRTAEENVRGGERIYRTEHPPGVILVSRTDPAEAELDLIEVGMMRLRTPAAERPAGHVEGIGSMRVPCGGVHDAHGKRAVAPVDSPPPESARAQSAHGLTTVR